MNYTTSGGEESENNENAEALNGGGIRTKGCPGQGRPDLDLNFGQGLCVWK